MDSLDFADAVHHHSGSDINSGSIGTNYFSAIADLTAEGLLDNNADTDLLTRLQADGRYVNTAGDDSMAGSLGVGGDLTVSGGNIGIGIAPNATIAVVNDSAAAPSYGAKLYGSAQGILGYYALDPANHYGMLGGLNNGVYGKSGATTDVDNRDGGKFEAFTQGFAIGAEGIATGSGASNAAGIRGTGTNSSIGDSYGGIFISGTAGTGTHYGIYASGNTYAGWFQDGKVHIGVAGVENYVDGNGDLYVQDELEVGGIAHFTDSLTVTGRINNAKFKSGIIPDDNYVTIIDLAGPLHQGEVHFGSAVDNQWVDTWFIYVDGYIIGNWIKYNGSTITSGHFRYNANSVIVYTNNNSIDSACNLFFYTPPAIIRVDERSASDGRCIYWSYDRTN